MVPEAGFEPARAQGPGDFESKGIACCKLLNYKPITLSGLRTRICRHLSLLVAKGRGLSTVQAQSREIKCTTQGTSIKGEMNGLNPQGRAEALYHPCLHPLKVRSEVDRGLEAPRSRFRSCHKLDFIYGYLSCHCSICH